MMNFNPLFMGQINTAGTSLGLTKVNKPNYLFSDIIKVILEDETELNSLPQIKLSESDETIEKIDKPGILSELNFLPANKLTSDFAELNTDELLNYSEVKTNNEFETEFEFTSVEIHSLFASLAGNTQNTGLNPVIQQNEQIKKLVESVESLNTDETLFINVEGLEEPLQVEIKRTDNPLKDFSVKFNILQPKETFPVENNFHDEKTVNTTGSKTESANVVNGIKSLPVKETNELSFNTDFINSNDTAADKTNQTKPIVGTTLTSENEISDLQIKTGNINSDLKPLSGTMGNEFNDEPEILIRKNPVVKTDTGFSTKKDTTVPLQTKDTQKDIPVKSTAKVENGIPEPKLKTGTINFDLKPLPKTNGNEFNVESETIIRKNSVVKTDTGVSLKKDTTVPLQTNDTQKDIPAKSPVVNKHVESLKEVSIKDRTPDSVYKNLEFPKKQTENKITIDFSNEINTQNKETANKPIVPSVKTDNKQFVQHNVKVRDLKTFESKTQPEVIERSNSTDTQKTIRLQLTNSENVKVRDLLSSVQNTETKSNELVQKTDSQKVFTETTDLHSKLMKDQLRVNSKIDFEKNIDTKKEVSFPQTINTTKEDSFTKLSGLDKHVLTHKVVDKSVTTTDNQSAEQIKTSFTGSSQTDDKPVNPSKNSSENSVGSKINEPGNELITKVKTDKPVFDRTVTIDDSPVNKEHVLLKDNIKTLNPVENKFTNSSNTSGEELQTKLHKDHVVRTDNELPIQSLHTEKKVNQEIENKSDNVNRNSSGSENVKINNTTENNFSRQENHNNNQEQENKPSVVTNQNTETEKLAVDKEKSFKETITSEAKVVTAAKPEIKESTVLSKEKIAAETKQLNDTFKTIRSNEIVKEITNFAKQGETKTITFKVVPESLGKIKVSLDVTELTAKATIEVETEAVKQIVQSNIETLKQSLTQNGINVSTINVSLNGSYQKQNRNVDPKRKVNEGPEENRIETEQESFTSRKMGYNTYEYLV